MSFILYPDKEFENIDEIPFRELYDEGYRGVILDIDNTVVRHGEPANQYAVDFFEYLRDIGYKTYILSNNDDERAAPFAKAVGSEYIAKAAKPLPGNYLYAMKQMGCSKDNCIFIGDQIFTDTLGARLAGIKSFLVKPVFYDTELQIVIKRYLEKIVLFFYHHSNSCEK